MTRCNSCGSHFCDGVACYLASPADFDGDPEFDEYLAQGDREDEAMRIEEGNEAIRKRTAEMIVSQRKRAA
jgi:hypothetical protein